MSVAPISDRHIPLSWQIDHRGEPLSRWYAVTAADSPRSQGRNGGDNAGGPSTWAGGKVGVVDATPGGSGDTVDVVAIDRTSVDDVAVAVDVGVVDTAPRGDDDAPQPTRVAAVAQITMEHK